MLTADFRRHEAPRQVPLMAGLGCIQFYLYNAETYASLDMKIHRAFNKRFS